MVYFLIIFIIMFGVLYFQFLLSRKKKWWLGLILPTLLFSVIIIGALAEFWMPSVSWETEDGVSTVFFAGALGSSVTFVSICNIPTLAMLAIYFVCRKNQKKSKAIEKMPIQDL
ncbi:MAG: hypothetical protein K6G88_09060 [Lachnospiraceae bacterium]|nr:hypothetical protein [Lachnospiraceae bacterium]